MMGKLTGKEMDGRKEEQRETPLPPFIVVLPFIYI